MLSENDNHPIVADVLKTDMVKPQLLSLSSQDACHVDSIFPNIYIFELSVAAHFLFTSAFQVHTLSVCQLGEVISKQRYACNESVFDSSRVWTSLCCSKNFVYGGPQLSSSSVTPDFS